MIDDNAYKDYGIMSRGPFFFYGGGWMDVPDETTATPPFVKHDTRLVYYWSPFNVETDVSADKTIFSPLFSAIIIHAIVPHAVSFATLAMI